MEPTGASESPRPRRRTGGALGSVAMAVGAGAVVVLGGITLAGRQDAAPPTLLAAAVTFLPYLYAACATALFGAWCLMPDRRLPPALIAVLVVAGGGLWGPTWPARQQIAEGESVRVMSWNVRRMWGGPDDGGDAQRCIVEAIEAEDPDVLALLEVSARDVAVLTEHLGLECVHSTYRGSESETHGGLATCARGGRWRLVGGGGQRYLDSSDWRYVLTELERDGVVFNLLAVHLVPYRYAAKHLRGIGGLPDVVRAQSDQSAALLERVARLRDATILAGDFNSTRDAALHASLRGHLEDTFERGGSGFGATVHVGDHVPLRIDYIYVTDEFAVAGSRVVDPGCSDHRAVVSDLVKVGAVKVADPAAH